MTSETKKRIAEINSGIVPDGYRKTKVGIVPVEWEVNQLSKYIVEYTEKTTINNQYPVLTSSRKGLMLQSEYFNNHQVTTEDNIGYNVLPRGYITFRSRTDDGNFRFNLNEIIDKGIVSYFYPVFDFSEKVDKTYMLNLLNFTIYKKYYPYVEGTAQQVMSIKKLGKLYFEVPPLPEQQKIAEILSTQDKLIELHEKKVEKLKELKKAYLQKMFPQKGSKYPEIRFKGFTDAWEQRKVEDVCEQLTSTINPLDYPDEIFTEYSMPAFDNCETADIVVGKSMNSMRKVIEKPCLLVNKLNVRKKRIWNIEKPENNAVCSAEFVPLSSSKSDLSFIKYILLTDSFTSYLEDCSSGSSNSQKRVTPDVIMSGRIIIPKIEEQKKIAEFLTNLDNTITLHQRKLDKEKEKKKALMQLLLTGKVRVKP